MKTKTILKVISILIVGIAIGIIIRQTMQTIHYKKVKGYEIIAKIKIIKEFINVREQATTKGKQLSTVNYGEKFDVVEIFTEEKGVYTWYKIIFSDRRLGWIASYDETPWVEVEGGIKNGN